MHKLAIAGPIPFRSFETFRCNLSGDMEGDACPLQWHLMAALLIFRWSASAARSIYKVENNTNRPANLRYDP